MTTPHESRTTVQTSGTHGGPTTVHRLVDTTGPLPAVPGPAAPRGPVPVVAIGRPRLTASIRADGRPTSLTTHRRIHGALPVLPCGTLTELIAAARLRGRGGAGFPTADKLRTANRAQGLPDLVVNGAESEPASMKDRTLLTCAPHLVLDGAQLLATELSAPTVVVWVHDETAAAVLREAVARRITDPVPVHVVQAPDGYLSGESSAALQHLAGGEARPAFTLRPAAEKGPTGRPTVVNNVETVAAVALLAHHGVDDHLATGTADEPGTLLLTVRRGPGDPVVVEAPVGTTVRTVLCAVQMRPEPMQAVLVGGYFGRWLPSRAVLDAPLSHDGLSAAGGTLGAGVIVAMPSSACALREVAAVVTRLAGQTAGQCGPCVNGLPAIARALDDLVAGRASTAVVDRLADLAGTVSGRGACRHPDGVSQFATSAVTAMPREVAAHLAGRCSRPTRGLLPRPALPGLHTSGLGTVAPRTTEPETTARVPRPRSENDRITDPRPRARRSRSRR